MTYQGLTRIGGFLGILAGVMLVAGATARYAGLSLLGVTLVFAGLAPIILAITAFYAVQAPAAGRIGLLGYVLAVVGQILVGPISFLWLASFAGVAVAHELLMFAWGVVPVLHLAVVLTVVGGILFGVATIRAGVLPRGAGVLIVAAEVLNLLVEYIPGLLLLYPVAALLFGVAFVWIGWVLAVDRSVERRREVSFAS